MIVRDYVEYYTGGEIDLFGGDVFHKNDLEGAVGCSCRADYFAQRAPYAGVWTDDYCNAADDSPSMCGAYFDAQSAPLALLGVYLGDIGHGCHHLSS
jgi:hypothetical protein